MLNADSLVFEEVAEVFAPVDSSPTWRWAEENVWLSSATGIAREYVGYWRSSYVPYTRGILDAMDDPETDWICVMKGVQLGITECSMHKIRRNVAEGAGDQIFAIDSEAEMKKISEKRLAGTTFKDSPPVAAMLPDDPDKMQTLTYYTKGSTVYLSGAGTAGKFANKPVPFVFLTELDKLAQTLGAESGPWEMAEDRRSSFSYGIQVGESQPATKEHKTWKLWLQGTQEIFFVPCPHCGMHQELVFGNLKFKHCRREEDKKWDKRRVEKESYFECANDDCGERITEDHKPWMLEEGQWVAMNDEALPGERSFHVSGFYSPMPRMKWGLLALRWLRSKDTEEGRRNFRNSIEGLPYEESVSSTDLDAVQRLCGSYERGTLPGRPLYLGMLVDVQGDVLKWSKIGFYRSSSTPAMQADLLVVEWGWCLTFSELVERFDEGIAIAGEEERFPCQGGLIDSGYRAKTKGIYSFCLASQGRFSPSKGRGRVQINQTVKRSMVWHEGRRMALYLYSDDAYKGELYQDRIEKGNLRLAFPRDADPDFLIEFTRESFKKVRGEWQWIQAEGNDFADTAKMGQVLWSVVSLSMSPEVLGLVDDESAESEEEEADEEPDAE